MPMKRRKGESKDEFMKRCVSDMSKEHDHDQAVAACLNMWSMDEKMPKRMMKK